MPDHALNRFCLPVRQWFQESLGSPTRAQRLGWEAIASGCSALILSPTGSGKTLAAFLASINELVQSPVPSALDRCRVLYISPLKALAVDVEKNLSIPLRGILDTAAATGVHLRDLSILVRTGDTKPNERSRMRRHPPDILITTPESLYLILTSDACRILFNVDSIIIDEIHALVGSKRGSHLALSLERLEALRGKGRKPLQRIGLSATQRPLDEVACFLVGFENGERRPVKIVDAGERKQIQLSVEAPMQMPPANRGATGKEDGQKLTSVWPLLHERLVQLIREHRTTLIFVNSRRLAERLASAINDLAGDEICLAHHGSIAKETRLDIETRLKRGDLPAIVSTSSLELGIDIGAIELVVQVEAPPSVAAGLQRIGRACHHVGGIPRGKIFSKHKADLVACAAAADRMLQSDIEPIRYPRNPLDVVSQQIVAMVSMHDMRTDDLYNLIRQAAPYSGLPRIAFDSLLELLSGKYPSEDFFELRPRITWDRRSSILSARKGARLVAVTNGGVIPDRGLYGVFLSQVSEGKAQAKRVGELDEEMVFELREGEVFLLGASAWRADEITHDRVLVSPANPEYAKMPFWHGDRPARPKAFGEAIGKLTRSILSMEQEQAETLLTGKHCLDSDAATQLIAYLREQKRIAGTVPSDKCVVVERFRDEIGDYRVCVLSPFGARVHAPWAIAALSKLRNAKCGDIDCVWSDDGIAFRVPDSLEAPAASLVIPLASEVEALLTCELPTTTLFASRFREAAARALLLPRRGPKRRQPLWAQRKRAADLMAVAQKHPGFPISVEANRECLHDSFDMPGLIDVLSAIESRAIRVSTIDSQRASPFASSLLFSFVANFMYDADAPPAERRMQALAIDPDYLRELLGEADIRAMLDPEVLDEHSLRSRHQNTILKHPDFVHDILLRIGDLSFQQLATRVEDSADLERWLRALVSESRVYPVKIAGEERYVAVEELARYRDALGVPIPNDIPEVFLAAVPFAAQSLLLRFIRVYGPVSKEDLARRFDMEASAIEDSLRPAIESKQVIRGAFLPQGRGDEFCDPEVLRTLRQRSLARLRKEIEPVDSQTYCRFLIHWQGLSEPNCGQDALFSALAQLQGCPLPASVIESDILPSRVLHYEPWILDSLCASGEVCWAGVKEIGNTDARIALYLAEEEQVFSPGAEDAPVGANAEAIRALLSKRGAMFFSEIVKLLGNYPGDILAGLWELVFAGEVSADSFQAVRGYLSSHTSEASRSRDRRHSTRMLRPALNRSIPKGAEGRFYLRSGRWAEGKDPTRKALRIVEILLDRYGVITREIAQLEAVTGGFAALYDALCVMEQSGKLRRGYFITGCGGAQFATPAAIEALRACRSASLDEKAIVLSAVDPANPYGAVVAWPSRDNMRCIRCAGAWVVLHNGSILGYWGKGNSNLVTFAMGEMDRARILAEALLGFTHRKCFPALHLPYIDGQEAAKSDVASAFLSSGFILAGDGLLYRNRLLKDANSARSE